MKIKINFLGAYIFVDPNTIIYFFGLTKVNCGMQARQVTWSQTVCILVVGVILQSLAINQEMSILKQGQQCSLIFQFIIAQTEKPQQSNWATQTLEDLVNLEMIVELVELKKLKLTILTILSNKKQKLLH